MDLKAQDSDSKRPAKTHLSTQLASICKAAADPLRLDILRVLSNDSFGVQELAAIFSMPQPGMSHHLKVLSKSGLLVTRRQGNSIFYRQALLKSDSDFHDFQASLFATVADLPLADSYGSKIHAVYKDRSSQSRLYFDRNVDKFEENQGMLCELSQYLPNIREILDLMSLPKQSKVLEVGPGQGELLNELAQRYGQLVALDSSEEMLSLTKTRVATRESIHFIRSSLEEFNPHADQFDAAVLNMVLHHISSPLRAFQKLRSIMRKNGYLLIADLCSHNQEWTRASCGDVWLGFDPHDLKDWGLTAGFVEVQSLYLGLKNGFQIQLKLFRAL